MPSMPFTSVRAWGREDVESEGQQLRVVGPGGYFHGFYQPFHVG